MSASVEQVPQQNLGAEKSVLGAILVAEPAFAAVTNEAGLQASDFYLDKHRTIFACLCDLHATATAVDELTVCEELRRRGKIDAAGGAHYVSELAATVPAAGNARHYAEIVRRHSLARAKRAIGDELQNGLAPAEAIDRLRKLDAADSGHNGRRLRAIRYSTVSPESARWAWDDRVPLGAVTVLAGRQGLGKSTLLASLAADLSRGRLPGELHGRPATILTASFEDTAPQVAARLLAADADPERVIELDMREDGHPGLLSVPGDLDLIAAAAREYDARALFVDPLMAALPGQVDSHRDQDVRRALAPLAQLSEESDLAVIAVLHLRKGSAPEALDRISGSVAFTAAARSVLAFGRTGDEEDAPGRVLAHAKSNLGPTAPSLAYRIEPATVRRGDEEVATSRLALDGECDVRAGELLSPPASEDRSEVEIAAEWLADELADGEWKPSREIKASARAADIRERTLKRAKQQLGVEDRRGGFPAVSEWRLVAGPGEVAQQSGQARWPDCESGSTAPDSHRPQPQSGQRAHAGPTAIPPCRYPEHRSSDYAGPGGRVICGVCHPQPGGST